MTSIQVHSVPRGWRRIVAVDAVYYVSPDQRVLWNRNDVVKHLTSRGTCKCGLQCPVDVDVVFCFNWSVPTGDELPPCTGSCAHSGYDLEAPSREADEMVSHDTGSCDMQEDDTHECSLNDTLSQVIDKDIFLDEPEANEIASPEIHVLQTDLVNSNLCEPAQGTSIAVPEVNNDELTCVQQEEDIQGAATTSSENETEFFSFSSSAGSKISVEELPITPSVIDKASLSPCGVNECVPPITPRVQLVDYDYDADSDSAQSRDEDFTAEGCTLAPLVTAQHTLALASPVGSKLLATNDSDGTDSLSDDSDSNNGEHRHNSKKFRCKGNSNYLAHNVNDILSDSGTASCDEKMEFLPDATTLETAAPSSSALLSVKPEAHESNGDSISPVLAKPSSCTEHGVHTIYAPIAAVVATPSVSAMVTAAVSTMATPFLSTPTTFASESTPPVSDNEDVPIVNNKIPTVSSSSANLSNSMSSTYNNTLPHMKSSFGDLPSISTTNNFVDRVVEDITLSCRDAISTPSDVLPHRTSAGTTESKISVSFAATILLPSQLGSTSDTSGPPFSAISSEAVIPNPELTSNSIVCSTPVSIPVHSSSIPVHSSSIPILESPVVSSSTSTADIKPESHLPETVPTFSLHDKADTALTASTCENVDLPTSIQSSYQKTDKENFDVVDDEPCTTFPAALTLSIDLSVLPQKRKVIQRAKWTSILSTPVPILRKRKPKATVTVTSTIIKSDRKRPEAKLTPKKQLQMSPEASQHKIGDIVWCKFSHWSLWPCAIILHSDVSQPEPTPDQVWVEWFGDHSYSKVDRGTLKTYNEGLQSHLSSRKKGKQNRKLEQSVAEVRCLVEGIPATKASTKKKKKELGSQKDSTSVEKEGCLS